MNPSGRSGGQIGYRRNDRLAGAPSRAGYDDHFPALHAVRPGRPQDGRCDAASVGDARGGAGDGDDGRGTRDGDTRVRHDIQAGVVPAVEQLADSPTVASESAATVASAVSVASAASATSAPTNAVALADTLAAGSTTPAQAVTTAAASAAGHGVTQYLSVVDRATGAVVAETPNSHQQVGSESIMKLFLAAYYILLYGGYTATPASVLSRLSYMLRYSDDDTASSLFTSSAIPTVTARYGLSATTNATDRPGHWGAARITAHDMTQFLYRASRDAEVGPGSSR